ncbi:MAG: 50S ribosomal protein L13 [Flavobacteriales bacterium]|uniref:50S ribosomal protein L13 n=1 Tax=Sanyastnella coralliicola TaxID=3069118 RepID=UPI003312FD0F|nr:50S ribosomal protein L13 [Flavobacteriales bacterium]
MDTLSYKTASLTKSTIDKKWVLIDAEGQTLGRLSTVVAGLLRGKHKPGYTPNLDCGDHVIVINAEKVVLSGNKWDQKEYIRHTGYPGGQRVRTAKEVLKRKPADLVEKSVKGMLPKNRLGRQIYRNLHVVVGPEHKHEAQQPEKYELNK